MSEQFPIIGASMALFAETELGRCVLAVQRTAASTDNPEVAVAYPNHWELPGGCMDPSDEGSAMRCAQREFHEETGIWVPEQAIVWRGLYRSLKVPGAHNAFFAAHMEHQTIPTIRLSGEAQAGGFILVEDFARALPAAVPGHVRRLNDYMHRRNGMFLREPVSSAPTAA
jgi:8-oxo-dGTP pyrophosphatase MutT (NUDIX family)